VSEQSKDDSNESMDHHFEQVAKKNKQIQERIARERQQANKNVLRSYHIK
jgi:hypothetical protein